MAPESFIFGYQLLMWLDTMGTAPPMLGIPIHDRWPA
jgi:hypothetical protein